MIDAHSFDDDYRPYPDMDSYYDTTDVKPANIIDTTIRKGDTVDTASEEYNKDHTDFEGNTAIRKGVNKKGNLYDIIGKVSWWIFRRLRFDD